ncbi:MAG: MvdC/MvdD family ATP grasp protein [Pseudonocardiaceae bacterium]
MTVLVLGRDVDPSTDRVVEALGERGVPVFRTDLAAFPQALTLDAQLGPDGWDGVLATDYREVLLSSIRSVWYRHPSHFVLPEGYPVLKDDTLPPKHAADWRECYPAWTCCGLTILRGNPTRSNRVNSKWPVAAD